METVLKHISDILHVTPLSKNSSICLQLVCPLLTHNHFWRLLTSLPCPPNGTRFNEGCCSLSITWPRDRKTQPIRFPLKYQLADPPPSVYNSLFFFLNDVIRRLTVAPPWFYLYSYHSITLHQQTRLKFPLWQVLWQKNEVFCRPLKSWSFSIAWHVSSLPPYLCLLVNLNWLAGTYAISSPVLAEINDLVLLNLFFSLLSLNTFSVSRPLNYRRFSTSNDMGTG
jgi:hypothetical protein